MSTLNEFVKLMVTYITKIKCVNDKVRLEHRNVSFIFSLRHLCDGLFTIENEC